MRISLRLFSWLTLWALTACNLAPDYVVPETETPTAFKEEPGWVKAAPADDETRGPWWMMFSDPVLNDLEAKATAANQTLAVAVAQYIAATAESQYARSALFPIVGLSGSSLRERESHHRPLFGTTSPSVYSDHTLGLDASYELDFWGKYRNAAYAAEALADASEADLRTAELSIHAELATDYFQIRDEEAQIRLLKQTIVAYRQALELTQARFKEGIAADVDVAEAETQLDNAEAQADDVLLSRAHLEHAIALLIGRAASDFSLDPIPLDAAKPVIPLGMPVSLLQRRPDVAAAERRVFSANAEIGVAKAAYYPDFSLDAAGGYEGNAVSNWFEGPSRFWSVGPSMALTLFDSGARDALDVEAEAAYDEAAANYRNTVLNAYREVEDNLAGIRLLDDEAKAETAAVGAAQRALDYANARYENSVNTYLEVVNAQATALQTQRQAVDVNAQALNARVALIKSLGGTWEGHEEPEPAPVIPPDYD